MDKQNKIYLYIAISIPILMIIITSLSLLYSKADLHPQYNFIYMTKNDVNEYQCWQQLKTNIFTNNSADTLKSTATNQSIDCSTAKLYEYDFTTRKSTLISLQQIKQMKLTPQTYSPDGFIISPKCNSADISGWSFYSRTDSSVCVVKGNLRQRLNIDYSGKYTYVKYPFFFVGWVLNSKEG